MVGVGGLAGAIGGGIDGYRTSGWGGVFGGIKGGVKPGLKLGVEGAGAIKDKVKQGAQAVVGAGKWVAGAPDQAMEAAGLVGEGTYDAAKKKQQQEDLKDPRERMATISDTEKLVSMFNNSVNKTERGAITERLGQLGAIDALGDANTVKKAAQEAVSVGADASKIVPQIAEFADELDPNRTKEERRKAESTLQLGVTKDRNDNVVTVANKDAYLDNEAALRTRQFYLNKRDNSDIKDIDDASLLNIVDKEGASTARGAVAIKLAMDRKIIGKAMKGSTADIDKLVKDMNGNYGMDIRKPVEDQYYAMAEVNTKRLDEILERRHGVGINTRTITNTDPRYIDAQKRARKEKLTESLPSMSDKQLRENVDIADLTQDVVDQFNIKQFRAFKNADRAKKAEVGKMAMKSLREKHAAAVKNKDKNERKRIIRQWKEIAKAMRP